MEQNIQLTRQEYDEFLKCKIMVDAIFETCEVSEYNGQAYCSLPTDVLKALFAGRYKAACKNAEEEHQRKQSLRGENKRDV